jgi:bacterioferritin (cytochrome b1)
MGNAALDGAPLIAELNDLLALDHDAVQAYTYALATLPDDAFRETLARFRGDHERHIKELAERVRAHGGMPLHLPHIPTGGFKLAVQALGTLGGLRETLLAFKANEGQVREKYRRYTLHRYPPDVMEVVQRALADEERHYAWAEEMLRRLGAGTDTAAGLAAQVFETVHRRTADLVEAAGRSVLVGAEGMRQALRP